MKLSMRIANAKYRAEKVVKRAVINLSIRAGQVGRLMGKYQSFSSLVSDTQVFNFPYSEDTDVTQALLRAVLSNQALLKQAIMMSANLQCWAGGDNEFSNYCARAGLAPELAFEPLMQLLEQDEAVVRRLTSRADDDIVFRLGGSSLVEVAVAQPDYKQRLADTFLTRPERLAPLLYFRNDLAYLLLSFPQQAEAICTFVRAPHGDRIGANISYVLDGMVTLAKGQPEYMQALLASIYLGQGLFADDSEYTIDNLILLINAMPEENHHLLNRFIAKNPEMADDRNQLSELRWRLRFPVLSVPGIHTLRELRAETMQRKMAVAVLAQGARQPGNGFGGPDVASLIASLLDGGLFSKSKVNSAANTRLTTAGESVSHLLDVHGSREDSRAVREVARVQITTLAKEANQQTSRLFCLPTDVLARVALCLHTPGTLGGSPTRIFDAEGAWNGDGTVGSRVTDADLALEPAAGTGLR